jgi:hypothetical protein
MGCLTIAELYLAQQEVIGELGAGATVTYYPVVLTGYTVTGQVRSPSEGAPVAVVGVFGEEQVTAPDGAITYATTFALSTGAYAGIPSPGDRVEYAGVSYRVISVRRAWFGGQLVNFVLSLGN